MKSIKQYVTAQNERSMMMKRVWSIVLMVAMVISLLPSSTFAESSAGSIEAEKKIEAVAKTAAS